MGVQPDPAWSKCAYVLDAVSVTASSADVGADFAETNLLNPVQNSVVRVHQLLQHAHIFPLLFDVTVWPHVKINSVGWIALGSVLGGSLFGSQTTRETMKLFLATKTSATDTM
jgi:hypothetical protein